MCEPSVIAPDWIVKGFHLKIGGVELAVRPDHKGEVMFQPVFSSGDAAFVDQAIRIAKRDCLPDLNVRNQWIKRINSVMLLLISERGGLQLRARGRLAEMNYLKIALTRYDNASV